MRRSASPAAGAAASIGASVLFGIIYTLAGNLDGFGSEEVTGWRIASILVTLTVFFTATRGWRAVRVVARRVQKAPWLALVILALAAIMWAQLWVFMWAPMNGHALDVSLGYFLLPLVMVVVGRLFFGDRLGPWQRAAVIAAAAGVAVHLVTSPGGIGWPTLLVALVYPLYFAVRRALSLDHLEAFWFEVVLLSPMAIWFIVRNSHVLSIGGERPIAMIAIGGIAALSGVAMLLYILASKLLPLGLFGLMSYLEPVLLLAGALLLGEALTPIDALSYGPIAVALVLLGIGGLRGGGRRDDPAPRTEPISIH